MSQTSTLNNKVPIAKINFLLISLLPVTLVSGTLVSNITIVLIGILFLCEIINEKKWNYLDDVNFYFLIIINIYLIFNSYFFSENEQSIIKSIGFIRFIIMAYAISYYFEKFKIKILRNWFLFFLLVTIDLAIEFIFGKNILGFESSYPARLASFTGDELKIGGYYFGFIFLALSIFFEKKKNLFWFFFIAFFIIALLIGERSNFIKIFFMYSVFFLFIFRSTIIKKILFIISIIIFSTIIISQIHSLKSKFVNQIFNKNLISFLKLDKDTSINDVISTNRHFQHYNLALNIFNKNKLFGSGFKSFRIEGEKEEYRNSKLYTSSTHPHQSHFEILSELGIVGYILIMGNIIILATNYLRSKNKNFLKNSALIFIIASMIPILPSGSFFTSYVATIFFINYSFLIRPGISNEILNKK